MYSYLPGFSTKLTHKGHWPSSRFPYLSRPHASHSMDHIWNLPVHSFSYLMDCHIQLIWQPDSRTCSLKSILIATRLRWAFQLSLLETTALSTSSKVGPIVLNIFSLYYNCKSRASQPCAELWRKGLDRWEALSMTLSWEHDWGNIKRLSHLVGELTTHYIVWSLRSHDGHRHVDIVRR